MSSGELHNLERRDTAIDQSDAPASDDVCCSKSDSSSRHGASTCCNTKRQDSNDLEVSVQSSVERVATTSEVVNRSQGKPGCCS